MKTLVTLIGLVLILEGLPYVASPEAMQRWLKLLSETSPSTLRSNGLIAMVIGFLVCTVYDPRVNLNYDQFVGEATGYGLDLEMNAYLTDDITLFVNPTYTSMTYNKDLVYAGKTLEADGNQVVDTPKWLLKTGLIWRAGPLEMIPMLRYIGSRYTDLENKGEVDGAAIVDLRMSYVLPNILDTEEMKLSLEINNLLDEEYVSAINASDDSRQGVASYYPGSPLSGMLTFSVKY